MNFKIIYVLVIITLLMVACKKDNDKKEGNRLKRTRHSSMSPNSTVDTFLYDSKNRLVGIKYLNSNSQYDKVIEYDVQGNLSRVVYSYQGVDTYSCSFIYNTSGQIIKKVATPFQGYDFAYDESYAYDNEGHLVADTTHFKQTSTVQYYMTFKYDSKGNITEEDFRNFVDPLNQGKTIHLYDNKPNPFYAQDNIYFYVTGFSSHLNRNNVINSQAWWSAPVVHLIEYQENGLPRKIVTDNQNAPFPFSYTVLFEYW